MYRNGMFMNLCWNKDHIETHHAKYWNDIKSYFGFQAELLKTPVSLPKIEPQKTSLLYQVATQCIYTCQPLLFSLVPLEYLHQHAPDFQWSPDLSLATRRSMEANLHDSLCQHLITTFSYRFFCENLVHNPFQTYCNTFYDCQPNDSSTDSLFRTPEAKKDHAKNLKRKYNDFDRDLSAYLSKNPNAHTKPYKSIWEDSPSEWASNKLQKYLQEDLNIDIVAPPNAWFLLFFVNEKTRFKNALKTSGQDQYVAFWEFLSTSGYFHTLFTEKNTSTEDHASPDTPDKETTEQTSKARSKIYSCKPLLFPGEDCSFAGIPFTSFLKPNAEIPDISYFLNGSNQTAKISSKLQVVFNNYLLERNFHLHAMATTEQHLFVIPRQSIFSNGDIDHLDFLSLATQLHAPLVHAPFINFLEQHTDILESSSLINRYVDRWNRLALPVLEELFIQSVYRCFPKTDDVLEAIDQWLDPVTYERLQIIRPVKVDKLITAKNTSSGFIDEKACHNLLVKSAFHIQNEQ